MSARRAVALALRDIKLAHTVFALPFALLASFLVRPMQAASAATADSTAWPRFIGQLALIITCMFFARTWAMLVNRVADARFDQHNPRTAQRAVASGALSQRAGWAIAIAAAVAFWLAAAGFLLFGNPWPALLAPAALLWIALYAYTKRFTALCHLFLGSALALSPVCAAIAIDPHVLAGVGGCFTHLPTSCAAIVCLSAFVALWVAGFDIPYALADIEHDRSLGLHSVPARFGVRGALWVSRALHALAAAAIVAFALVEPSLGWLTLIAAGVVAALLIYEHAVLARRGVAGLPIAFFTINGVISILFSTAAITDSLF